MLEQLRFATLSKKNKIKSNIVEISVLNISKINLKNSKIELKERFHQRLIMK